MFKLEDFTPALFQEFVDSGQSEGSYLDFKSHLRPHGEIDGPKAAEEGKNHRKAKDLDHRWVNDAIAFSNTDGGFLLFGVAEHKDRKGIAATLRGISGSPEEVEQRIRSLLRARSEPEIRPRAIRHIDGDYEQGPIRVVEFAPSPWRPHRRIENGQFYRREGAASEPMAIDSLRDAFLSAEDLEKQAEEWRQDALSLIRERRNHLQHSGLILHLVPPGVGRRRARVDLRNVEKNAELLVPFGAHKLPENIGYSFDSYSAGDGKGQVRVYRTGVIQSRLNRALLEPIQIPGTTVQRVLSAAWFVKSLMQATERMLRLAEELDLRLPCHLLLSMWGLAECRLLEGDKVIRPEDGICPGRNILEFPAVEIGAFNANLGELLQPLLDVLWQSFGEPEYPGYEAAIGRTR